MSRAFLALILMAVAGSAAAAPRPVVRYGGLAAPERVLYDASGDRYLVSNVNGEPGARDDNGFISVLSPAGRVTTLKWIAGGRKGVTLHAPKGLAIIGRVLYVADLTVVRRFDLHTGAPLGEVAVPGSTYLNGLATAPDGKLYVSDSGPPQGSFDAHGTEAVYVIEGARVTSLAKGSALGRPTGIAWTEGGPVVVPFGSSEVYRLDDHGTRRDVTPLPAGGLAGVVRVGDSLLVASWQTSSILRGKLGGRFEVALADQTSPADLGYDTKRGRLLVPHLTEGTVDAFNVK
jgi:hypothetical protein